MLREKGERTLVVAFRGANSKHVQGMLTDVALAPVPAIFGSRITQVHSEQYSALPLSIQFSIRYVSNVWGHGVLDPVTVPNTRPTAAFAFVRREI